MKRYIVWIILAVAVVGLGLFLTMMKPENAPTTSTSPSPAPQTQATTPPAQTDQSQTAAVNITKSGFEPNEITVAAGTTVTWTNQDSQPHWPASNPHPAHTGLPGFDALKGISNGQTYSFKFDKAGTFGYHDHLNPASTGRIIVQ